MVKRDRAAYMREYRRLKKEEVDQLDRWERENNEWFATWDHTHDWGTTTVEGIQTRVCWACGGKERREVPVVASSTFNSRPFTPVPKGK